MDDNMNDTMGNNVSFRVHKDDLSDAVAWVARSLPTKNTQPILRAVVITADDNGLEFAGFDYEVSSRVRIAAEVDQPGRIAVAGKLMADIVANMPAKPVEVSVDNSRLLLQGGSARFELPLMPLDDYPQLPTLPETTGTVSPSEFVQAVTQVASAAGKDDTLPMLTGVHIEIDGANVQLAATDRFRLAMRTMRWQPVASEVKANLLVPAKTLLDNARTLDTQLDDPVEIAVGTGDNVGGDGLFGLHSANRETTTRMLDADFPNIQPLLPKTHTSMASIEISPLLEAIRRVSLVADRNAQLRMEFRPGELTLYASGADSGEARESLPCAFSGADELIIAFNSGYLKDGLNVIRTDRAVFGFTEPSRPAIMIPEPEEMSGADADGTFPTPATEFTYLLMPVRLPG
ncbi:DNA polymerase III subunit beta [Corynebacterium cystitidis]|uniref:Beta sliding clamp n=1 Tax=Corynebacterium cystitidis DSM 20524 TaxID=1121357 RepID=A0A1H9UJH3_9CORY|nr:DNA polymerase III subunit beta [Corynebacterium cystitidis]WJY80990.1 DNA polymerase III subunit beta [Corynebacterium cystitidis DSM 20524]SES09595.1 DNA polymerase-3 subunit beta [Corynebacterium cystitidis DSM 20524]SNV90861.1 DNA polymerase III subunit beta [Corynebacterium cystitidis]